MKVKNVSSSVAIITDMVTSGQGLIVPPDAEIIIHDEDAEKSPVLQQYISDGIIEITGSDEGLSGAIDADTLAALDTQVNNVLYVDKNRTDTYTATGSSRNPYLTIGAAIAEVSGETLILVAPGSYTEDIVLPANVHIQSLSVEKVYITEILGSVTFNGVGLSSISGIDIKDDGVAPTITFTGTGIQRLSLTNLEVNSSGALSCLLMNNTGVGSVVVASDVNFNNTAGNLAVKVDAGKLSLFKTQINSDAGVVACQFNGSSQIEAMMPYFTGRMEFNATSGGLILSSISNATAAAIVKNGGTALYAALVSNIGGGSQVSGAGAASVVRTVPVKGVTAVQPNATEINSAIALVNELKGILNTMNA